MQRNTRGYVAGVIGVVIVALAMITAVSGPATAQTESRQKVVVHLTHYTDNLHAAKMAVHLAHLMQTMSADVTLLLDLEGVRLANSREPQNLIWGKGDTLASDYDAFVKAGGRVLLCPHCSEHAGVIEKNLRSGARIGKTGELAKTILAAEKVLDY
jgi:predicted peroxiredoxin